MSMILIVLLVVFLPPVQTAAAQTTSTMQPDVDRLVQAAEKLAGTWPSQPPPAIPEVGIVVRHGKAVVPLLMVLLSDDPDAERDPKRWKVQQQVALALSRIYSESQHCGRTYCDGDPPERIARIREMWLNVIASDKEMQALSSRDLLDRFKMEKVFWRQFEIAQALAATNNRSAIAELEVWLTHDDRHLRGNVAFVLGPLARGSLAETGTCRRRFVLTATTPRIWNSLDVLVWVRALDRSHGGAVVEGTRPSAHINAPFGPDGVAC